MIRSESVRFNPLSANPGCLGMSLSHELSVPKVFYFNLSLFVWRAGCNYVGFFLKLKESAAEVEIFPHLDRVISREELLEFTFALLIGTALAKKAQGCGMRVIYTKRNRLPPGKKPS
jgi:hypothetical protein